MNSPVVTHTRGARILVCGWGKCAMRGSMAPSTRATKITEVGRRSPSRWSPKAVRLAVFQPAPGGLPRRPVYSGSTALNRRACDRQAELTVHEMRIDTSQHFFIASSLNRGGIVPEKETLERAKRDAAEGKAPTTQAGEFVREEMDHIREGKHGARSTKQAIAIGLSKARRAGVPLKPPAPGKAKSKTRKSAARAYARGRAHKRSRPSATRSRATSRALKREGHSAASKKSLARQARSTARARGTSARHRAAMKAVRTKGKTGLTQAAQKAAHKRAKRATPRRAA